jgi:gamma-glutamyl:cysteine ligase YbdK (ATP-grasp superfamily)
VSCSTTKAPPLAAFAGFGVEIEYMIVERRTLDVLPVTDQVIRAVCGAFEAEIEQGPLSWSNELVLHVIELKTNGPVASLAGLPDRFQADVRRINGLLEAHAGRLLPTGMHPWMDPHREMRLWPHEYNEIYEAYNAIFDCRGHGWANLQATHLNLAFADDREFARMHAAIRLLLAILPAIAASTPIADGAPTGLLDTRLEVYRHNARIVPSITGRVIPEPVSGRREYERLILEPMYRDIGVFERGRVLQNEWLNSRGAIARFDRGAIEIRVLDVQECPRADLAIAAASVAVVAALYRQRWRDLAAQSAIATEDLERILLASLRDGELTVIEAREYLAAFGFPDKRGEARELWQHLLEQLGDQVDGEWLGALRLILREGPLARRILRAVKRDPRRARLAAVYGRLADCLAEGSLFEGID